MRYFSNNAVETALADDVTDVETSIVVSDTTGFPATTPYTLALDVGQASEELVEVTSAGGTTLTVARGADNTSAQAHTTGAVVQHVHSARDFGEPQAHMDSSAGVHGVTGSVVGTTDIQTVSNKTLFNTDLSDPNNTLPPSVVHDVDLVPIEAAIADTGFVDLGTPIDHFNNVSARIRKVGKRVTLNGEIQRGGTFTLTANNTEVDLWEVPAEFLPGGPDGVQGQVGIGVNSFTANVHLRAYLSAIDNKIWIANYGTTDLPILRRIMLYATWFTD